MNSMSLLRNSVIVGGATFLVGSALMEVSKGDEKVGWWPYTATFLSGALGFYLLRQQFVPVPEALELDAEYVFAKNITIEANDEDEAYEELGYIVSNINDWDIVDIRDAEYDFQNQAITTVIADNEDDAYEELATGDLADEDWEIVDIRDAEELRFFAAEVFEADRKIRRRTRWTWTRGPEDGFTDKTTVPYADLFTRRSRKGRGYYSSRVDAYNIEDAYHINDLPEGYHLHLFKPTLRKDSWMAYAKSPKTEEWIPYSSDNKSALTGRLLDWYNKDIAQPKQKALSPIDKLKISKGLKSGKVQIERVVIPATVGKQGNILTAEQIQYYALGGPNQLEPVVFANVSPTNFSVEIPISFNDLEKYDVFAFAQGLVFIGESAGTLRSVNRYNKDRQQWVKSYPAWFQNGVRNKLTGVKVGIPGKRKKYGAKMTINDYPVVKFFNGAKEYSWDTENRYGNTELKEIDTQYGKQFQFEILDPEGSGNFITPRPSTQRKIYDESFNQDLNGEWKFSKDKFKMAIIDRYQYERKNEEIQESMQTGSLSYFTPKAVAELMFRRFKKN